MAPTAMKLRVRRRNTNNNNSNQGDRPPEEAERNRGSRRRKRTSAETQAAVTPPPAPSARAALTSAEASPDSKCPICLDRFNNMAYLDRCLHRFCFPCIQEWSHNKAECPLCKQPFTSILHSVRAEDDFKEYTLGPTPTGGSVAATVAMVAAMASAARSDQLRLMLRRHRVGDATEPATRSQRREAGGAGRSEDEQGVWQWYLDVPPLPLVPHHSDQDGDRGVIFEGLSGFGEAVAGRASQRLVTRLAARLRLQREGVAVRRLREGEMVAFRRALYRGGIRVHGVAGAGATQPQRDISVDGFRRDRGQLNRLRPWLRRELTVLYGSHGSLVDVVHRVITARLARRGLEDAAAMEEELRPFLLAQTQHFLHELLCFARSPLGLDEYDLQAAYHPPPADGGGSASSSVITISEEEGEEEAGRRRNDQTPGPSYSATLPSLPSSPAAQEDEGECMIVGYKKPMAERTPELVHLSSDSERSSPAVPPSTSTACLEKNPAVGSVSSVCTLSPPPRTPADKKKKKKKRRRSRERVRKSGTLANPNRSIYPAMMRCLSYSSLESGSPLALSPPDCGWAFSSSSSSSSSSLSSSSSSSPICSSSPPPPSPQSPSRSGGEKPGGKRKYKSRHLDERSHRQRGAGRSKKKSHADKMAAGGNSTRGLQHERSPSVEIVFEGTTSPKRHRETQRPGRMLPVITLDSSDDDDGSSCVLAAPLLSLDCAVVSDTLADVKDGSFSNQERAAVCQVRSDPAPPAPAPPLELLDEGNNEEEEKEANFFPTSSSLDFLSHTTDLFQIDAAAGGDLSAPPSPSISAPPPTSISAPPSPSIMSCPL
ncbi:E3 ubiquitin-protein ligase Topors-like [Hippocampus zosterae]|uniref:E3 ubiquitin-protein ligase Topors-like n=1 Tax=Hippocampus zosterae TaxID=109293 RepID=UPI00223CF65A|nr:E3 ubiquitin-protein ligase Topors-like [Hippocampus zosterae]